jgi:hypothetical protein
MKTEPSTSTEAGASVAPELEATEPAYDYYDDYGHDFGYLPEPPALAIDVFFPPKTTFGDAALWCAYRPEANFLSLYATYRAPDLRQVVVAYAYDCRVLERRAA